MTPIVLTQVIDCLGATVRNDALQPPSDPPLTLSLKAKGKQIYVLPLSERGAVAALGSAVFLASRARCRQRPRR
jgi:hypothetical protein